MTITIEEAKAFIVDAQKAKDNWQIMADRSWNEIKKRQKNHRLWSVTPNSLRKRARYPAWWSIFKIRQPLLLSRVGVPICKDTTQDATDTVGATAAILKERLAVNIAKSFNFFDVLCSSRDDFLATNFGQVRAFYECDEVKVQVKQYITPQKDIENPNSVVFVDSEGKVIESDDIYQDDEGYFVKIDQVVDIDNERIYLEAQLYKHVYLDPEIRRYDKVKRIAFENYYSAPEFKKIFGSAAFLDLSNPDPKVGSDEASPKNQNIKVFEYWDFYDKDTKWFAENGSDFITPAGYLVPDNEDDDQAEIDADNGMYNLEKFFPCPNPLIMNQTTDEFWPIPEYYQLVEIFEDIHQIFSRMFALTKSMRVRLLFDNNIDGLQAVINEAAEGDAFGVPNLTQALKSAGGTLDNCIQYLNVAPIIEGVTQLYTALTQRLQAVQQLSGTGDLLQGMSSDGTGKTLGERQIEEKYAINQIAEAQDKMSHFVRDCYELMCEMAIKNFKQASLDIYLIPATLQPTDQANYQAAIGMLKENNKRFRIDLETDSTIALNEQYDKQQRAALYAAVTTGIEKTANTASSNPPLAAIELHALKFLVQGERQGKMFQQDINAAIDEISAQLKAQKPPFNPDMAKIQVESQKNQLEAQWREQKNQVDMFIAKTDANREDAQLQLNQRIEAFKEQIESLQFQFNEMLQKVTLQNQGEREQRLEEQLAFTEQMGAQPKEPAPPQVVVIPTPAPVQSAAQPIILPQSAPTIINAPAQTAPEPGVIGLPNPLLGE